MKKRITGLLIVLCIILSMAAPVSAKESEATVVKMVHSEGTHAAILSDGSLWMWGKAFSETPEKILDGIGDIQLFKGFGNTYAALGTDGSLWMWGGNDSGQLGDGTTEGRNTPVKVLDNVSRVKLVPRLWFDYGSVIGPDGRSVYGVTVIALCNDGSLWMWGGVLMGYSEVAELAAENPYRPVKVMDDVSSFEIWGNNAAIIRTDGSLWTWGVNSPYGVLGRGSAGEAGKTVYPPQKVLDNIESVTMAGNSVFALSPEGTLWQWGHVPFETEQYVEEKFSYDSSATYYAYYSPVPVRVMENVKSLSTVERGNDFYAVALQSDGTLWTQGYYYEDHEGAEQIQKTQYDWYRALQDVREYNLGTASSGISAILKDGSLWMWGSFRLTAIGRRDKDLSYWQPSADTDYPLRVLGNAASVHGDYIFCNDGTLWQLRHLYTDEELEDLDWDDDIPRERVVKILDNVKSLEESRVDGRNYFAAICEDGSLWMWGDNQYGQLGTGDCNNRNEPVKVMDNVTAVFLDNYDFSERSGSFTYVMQRPKTYVVRGDGSFCAFGYGADGELGLKTPEQYSALPVKVTFEEPYVPYRPSVDGWGFSNLQALGYILTEQELTDKDGNPDTDKLGQIVFDKDLWTDAMGTGFVSDTLYNVQNYTPIVPSAVSGGLCWGMAVASALDYLGLPETKVWKETANSASDVRSPVATNKVDGREYKYNLLEYIEVLWAYQFRSEVSEELKENKTDMCDEGSYQRVIDLTRRFEETGKDPILISITEYFGIKALNHVLIPYRVEEAGNETRVYVYDCNAGRNEQDKCFITFKRTGGGGKLTEWSYPWEDKDGNPIELGCKITDIGFEELTYLEDLEYHAKDILGIDLPEKQKQYLEYFLFIVPPERRQDIYTYYDYSQAVIECRDGKAIESEPSRFLMIFPFSGEADDVNKNPCLFYVPQDEPAFRLVSRDGLPVEAELVSDEASLSVRADSEADVEISPCGGNLTAEVTPSSGDREISFSCTYASDDGDVVITVAGCSDLRAGISLSDSGNTAEVYGFSRAEVTVTKGETVTTCDIGSGSYELSLSGASETSSTAEIEKIDARGGGIAATVSGIPSEGAKIIAAAYDKDGKCQKAVCRTVSSDRTETLPIAAEADGTVTVFLLSNDGTLVPLCEKKTAGNGGGQS